MMRTTDLLRLSTRMFKTRPLRTWLTILGVGVGIAATFFLVSFGYGLQTILLEQITTSESLLSLDVHPPESGVLPLSSARLDAMRALPTVQEVSPVAHIPAQISFGNFTGDALSQLVTASYFRLEGIRVTHGRVLDEGETDAIVVSGTVAKLVDASSEELLDQEVEVVFFATATDENGDAAQVVEHRRTLRVVGVVESEPTSLAYATYDVLPEATVPAFAKAKVRVASSEVLNDTREQIKAMGYTVLALSDTIEEANKIFKAIQVILALFGVVALIVAAIGMFNTVTIALLERTQEIGIMRAIGASRADMLVMFLTESALMGFLGGLSGLAMGYAGGEIVNIAINLLASRLGAGRLDLFVHPTWFVLTIIVFSTVIGFVTGILPARRAARINTLEALRYK